MAGRKVFEDSVVPLPHEERLAPSGLIVSPLETQDALDRLEVLFSLSPDPAVVEGIEARVAAGETVSGAELELLTAPAENRDRLVEWLDRHGFSVDYVSQDGTSVYTTSTVANIAEQLHVEMARVTRDGVTYSAARNAPSLPDDVAEGVRAILGLQPFRQANKHRRFVPVGPAPDDPPLLAPQVQNVPPYLVAEMITAYGADGLTVTGAGQVIAILIDTVPERSDLEAFWERNELSVDSSQVSFINVKGAPLPPPEGEETLDVEWSIGIAPGASVRVYASGSLQFVDLDRALDSIVADVPRFPGMRQLSISLGLGETYFGGPDGEVAVQHQKFLRLAAAGVNVFVSSGDAGSNPDQTGHDATGPTQVEYESSDSMVVGVGGTSLRLGTTGGVTDEIAWPGSGGGQSQFFARPVWQTGPGVPTGDARLVPDVSLVADPNTGALIIFQGREIQVGGTSLSAPMWAGFCALLNEARLQAGLPAAGFLNPLLYPLAGSATFRDITSGSNGAFTASAGYDPVTGLGVPDVRLLIASLTA